MSKQTLCATKMVERSTIVGVVIVILVIEYQVAIQSQAERETSKDNETPFLLTKIIIVLCILNYIWKKIVRFILKIPYRIKRFCVNQKYALIKTTGLNVLILAILQSLHDWLKYAETTMTAPYMKYPLTITGLFIQIYEKLVEMCLLKFTTFYCIYKCMDYFVR